MSLALLLVALILGIIELARSKATSIVGYAICALALAFLWGRF